MFQFSILFPLPSILMLFSKLANSVRYPIDMPSPVSPLHSTLELAQHDATASAPERDDDATGLNHDTIFDAPQVRGY